MIIHEGNLMSKPLLSPADLASLDTVANVLRSEIAHGPASMGMVWCEWLSALNDLRVALLHVDPVAQQ